MKKWFCIIVASLLNAVAALAADGIPSKYVGAWATEGAVFNGMLIIDGQAVYLDADGIGMSVGASMRKCGDRFCPSEVIGVKLYATVEKDNENLIRADVMDEYGRKVTEVRFRYDPKNEALIALNRDGEAAGTMKRRFDRLSEEMKKMVHEPPLQPRASSPNGPSMQPPAD